MQKLSWMQLLWMQFSRMTIVAATAAMVAATITLTATPLAAAPVAAGVANATPLLHSVQYDPWSEYGSYGYGYGYRPACPTNYQYSCWSDGHGFHHCGCLLNPRRWWWW